MKTTKAFRMADDLLAESVAAETKADRTRLKLMASAAALLDDLPFPQLRPSDLADRAGITRPLLYHYFNDLGQLVLELIERFESSTMHEMPAISLRRARYGYAEIHRHLAWLLSCYLRNRGLFRLIYSLPEQLPEGQAIVDRIMHTFHKSLGDLVSPIPGLRFDSDARMLAGYMVGGGFDGLLRQLFLQRNEKLPEAKTPQELADLVQLMSALRYRQVHGASPDPKEIRAVAREFDVAIFDDCAMPKLLQLGQESRRVTMPRQRLLISKRSG